MFVLGFKRDARFATTLNAVAAGASTGVTNAADEIEIYGAIHGNIAGLAKTVQKIHADFGANIPPTVKHEIYKIILEELTEENYGGRWYDRASVPPDNWVR